MRAVERGRCGNPFARVCRRPRSRTDRRDARAMRSFASLRAGLTLEDGDAVDHKPLEEMKCMPKCSTFVKAYEACVERIAGDETGEAHCTVSERASERGRVRGDDRRWRRLTSI